MSKLQGVEKIPRRRRRKSKRIHKIKFADGKVFTILDIEPERQTDQIKVYMRTGIGVELLLIPLLLGAGLLVGFWAYKAVGAFVGLIISGIIGLAIVTQLDIGNRTKTVIIDEDAIIGFDTYYQMKSKSYTFCCHSFDSEGNEVLDDADPLSIMAGRIRAKNRIIKTMRGEITTMLYRLSESQMSRKELVDSTSATLKKMITASVVPARAKIARTKPAGFPPEAFIGPEEGEEEED